ncbi:hypothetical protein [Enterobacter sp. R1(2018)]|uniref:hypothetical protein n=1 Tax=Enterobacter sp. R1(2018) TaxID=2447891 RepID=UPI000EB3C77D|nr:hypothetical protein [Enterobacter sp. R1(2018)]RKQ38379.1 hypothetical protein D8M09_17395 [Enterobacter sp. R1(2018)]
MSIQNTIALLNWYKGKHVQAVRTPSGIVLMGARNLTAEQKRTLLAIPQAELDAAIRWQK